MESFPDALDGQAADSGPLRHGRVYVFHRHLAFDTQLPFGLHTTAVIPRKVRTCTLALFAALAGKHVMQRNLCTCTGGEVLRCAALRLPMPPGLGPCDRQTERRSTAR